MEKAATDIYTFEELRNWGFTYVDKTAILEMLADGSRGKQFFIARPRRFGKSLAVSTLKALFEGKRELFKGLAIEPEWDWSKKWPVLHLDMGSAQTDSVSELKDVWRTMLADECRRNNIAFRADENPATAFRNVLNDLAAASDDGQAVVIVDEYDKPMLGHLMTPEVTEFKTALKAFYSVLKTLESKQRFTFITGVSKFSKVSIFSDLNNLKDYTLNPVAATLFGYTHDEVRRYFPENIAALGKALGKSPDGAFADIVKWYDGYRFHQNAEPVINPVSLGMTFDAMELGNWWSKTAIPTFLVDFFRQRPAVRCVRTRGALTSRWRRRRRRLSRFRTSPIRTAFVLPASRLRSSASRSRQRSATYPASRSSGRTMKRHSTMFARVWAQN